MSEKSQNIKEIAERAVHDEQLMADLAEQLEGSSRRSRQNAASVFAQIAKVDPEALLSYLDAFIDALNRHKRAGSHLIFSPR